MKHKRLFFKSIAKSLLLLLLFAGLWSCGGGGGGGGEGSANNDQPQNTAPVITTQPQSTTVNEGATATFTVAATGTTPLTYQWKKNGTNISGATSVSYTTPATASTDNGAIFSVVVTNSVSSVSSASAMLTVSASAVSFIDRSVSRTSGVAPLSVHFFAGIAQGGASSVRGFSDYDYSWNFGDAGSGVWGTDGKSKNSAKGAVAAHVFETPGTYTVTLTVRDKTGTIDTDAFQITVTDPDTVYSGIFTTCVNPAADTDFTGAPAGSRQISTDNLSTITQYATAGSRILFKRGSSWTTAEPIWPNNAGPVTIGAYGVGTNPDALGIFENAPQINVTGECFLRMSDKQNWRLMDIRFNDPSGTSWGAIGGAYNFRQNLILRLKTVGFSSPLGWSFWNNDSGLMVIDQMAVVSCDVAEGRSISVYIGAERLSFLGNKVYNNRESHVVRVWQGYKGVISHNLISGSSLDNTEGRHALKLSGPSPSDTRPPVPGTLYLENRTDYVVVSDNVFGSSGPWPVSIGPTDPWQGAEVTNVIFERNRVITEYGDASSTNVKVGLYLSGRYSTIRNNIFDGTNSDREYTAILIKNRGIEPPPLGVEIYNNTIFRGDGATIERIGIDVGATSSNIVVKNNLVSFPSPAGGTTTLLRDQGSTTVAAGNLLAPTASFVDAEAVDALSRNFRLIANSVGINQGVSVPVYEDFDGLDRPNGAYDVGAFENQ